MIAARAKLGARVAALATATAYQIGRLEAQRALVPAEQRRAFTYRRVSAWALQLIGILGMEVRLGGHFPRHPYPSTDARGRGRLFIFDHRSALDILLSLAFFEGNIVSRGDLANWPLIGYGARSVGVMFVDRQSVKSGAAVIARMTRALEEGAGVCIYPEGTAYDGDEVRPLHAGGFKAANRAGAEIVPVGICYDDPRTCYGDESFAAHAERVGMLERVVAAVEVGAPFSSDAPVSELQARGRRELQTLVDRARKRLSPSS